MNYNIVKSSKTELERRNMYNSNDLKDITKKLVKLDPSKRQFINGLIAGLEISEADQNIREPAAPAAKEPEKQEEANVQGTPRTNASTTGSHM
jgi:hypothetical protein